MSVKTAPFKLLGVQDHHSAASWATPENIHTHPMDDIGNPVRNAQ